MSELPTGWSKATMQDIADIQLGKMLDAAKNKGVPVPYLRNINVRWGCFDLSDVFEMRMTPEEQDAYSIYDDDVLICEGGEPGRAAVWCSGQTSIKFQKALHRARTYAGVAPKLIAFYMQHIAAGGELKTRFTGTTIKHLPLAAIRKMPIPLPPSLEQQRIVAKIDRLSANSKRAREHLDHIPRLVDKYKQAILAAAFNVLGHRIALSEVTSRITKGASPKWQGFKYLPEGILFVRSQNVGWGKLLLDERVYLSDKFNAKQKNSVIREWDVLLNIVGASIGRTAVASKAIIDANCNQAVAVIRLNVPNEIDARYMNLWLQSDEAQKKITLGSVDVARANFSLGSIGNLILPWPKQEIRSQIVRRIETAIEWIDRLASEPISARKLIDHLDQAILAKAFRGELVPQDSNDEPASALLERIRTERSALPDKPRGRAKKTA
jgi:type I restriction enzyme, S subunit